MCVRELECEQRCWGTLLSEPSCVFNLLTHFQGARSRVSPIFSPSVIPQQLQASLDHYGQTIPCPPSPPPTISLLLLVLRSSILSSVCLHPSALASFTNLLICPLVKKKKKKLYWCCLWGSIFQGWCQRTTTTREVLEMKYGEKRHEVEGQTGGTCLCVSCGGCLG